MSRIVEIVTTVATEEDAGRIARSLVESRLAACVHVDAIQSTYRWKGSVCHEAELRVVVKTTDAAAESVERWLSEHHPYETPAILRVPVERANGAYEAWVEASVRNGGDES